MARSSPPRPATAPASSRANCSLQASPTATPAPTTRRPAARSSASTRPWKKRLTCQRPATTIRALQARLDRFAAYYNTRRPHRAIGRATPAQAYTARIKATPAGPQIPIPAHCRVRQDTIDTGGSVTLRYRSKLYHIGVGRRHAGTKVTILIAGLSVRILTRDGSLLRQLTLDPARNYQPQRLPASP